MISRYRDDNANLRTSRETELVKEFPCTSSVPGSATEP
jgi:hypothetical protein